MASRTVLNVWSPNTPTRIAVPAARNGAICASIPRITFPRLAPFSAPSHGRRRTAMRIRAFRETSTAATAIRPVGPAPSARVASSVPIAAGSSRWVAMARSKETQVSSEKTAMIGSGRVPLLKAMKNIRKATAVVQCATAR